MNLCISLGQNIQCESICNSIQMLVNKFIQEGGDAGSSLLVINITTPLDYTGDSPIQKLTYEP